MLGVIIGIASIIAIVSTIAGTNQQIMQNLIGAGNNSVTISLQQGGGNYWMDAGAPDGAPAPSAVRQAPGVIKNRGEPAKTASKERKITL